MNMGSKVAAFGLTALLMTGAAFGQKGDAKKGKEVFEQCGVCHNTDTDEKKMGPSLKGLYKKAKMANGDKPTDPNVLKKINAGGNGMPAYEDMLSKEEKDHVLAYLKTL